MAKIRIDIHNCDSYVYGEVPSSVFLKLREELSFRVQNCEFSEKYNTIDRDTGKRMWDGRIYLIRKLKNCLRFSTGLLSKAREVFDENGIEYAISDSRENFDRELPIELADSLIIRDYQEDAVDKSIKRHRGIIKAATGSGKCISEMSLCLTEDGIYRMNEISSDLSSGEYAIIDKNISTPISPSGIDCAKSVYYDGCSDSLNIETQFGYSICGTKNHKIKVLNRENNLMEWKKLCDLEIGDLALISKGQQIWGKSNELSGDAYLFGLLIAGGEFSYKNHIRIFNEDKHIIDFFEKYCYERNLLYKDCEKIYICDKEFRQWMCDLGFDYSFSINKKIPLSIRESNKDIVSKFIRGIYEIDGWIEDCPKICVRLSSEQLADDIHTVLLNFGIISSKTMEKTKRSSSYIITIYSEYIRKFMQEIGLDPNGIKYEKLFKIMSKYENDDIDLSDDVLSYSVIKKIENKKSFNYDLVVPDTHSFVANGFINHNTVMAASIIQRLGLKGTLFLAMSGDLVLQAKDEFKKFLRLNGEPIDVGQIGAGICDIKDINVCTVQSLCTAFDMKYKKADDEDNTSNDGDSSIVQKKEEIRKLITDSKCIIFDEVQHAACDTVRDIMTKASRARYRFGMSASPWRDDGADLFIDSHFGKSIVDISASYLIRKKYLVKPTIYFIKVETPDGTYSNYQTIYKNFIVNNVTRNNAISELAKIHELKGNTVLVLVKQIVHGKMLESMIDGSVFISGQMSAKKRKIALDEIRENKQKIVIASTVFDEGIDIKRLNCLIMASSGKSSTRALQRIGRVLRPFEGKDCATIYDFMDTAKYLSAHARARKKIYKTEDEFEIKELKIGEWNECENNIREHN